MDETIEKHLKYEVSMLSATYVLLDKVTEPKSDDERIDINMKIESFCVHARNLYEFLFQKPKLRNAYVPAGYRNVKTDYSRKNGPIRQLNSQITHMIYEGRTDEPVKQIDAADRFSMLNELRAELEKFRSEMTDQNLANAFPKIPAYGYAAPINTTSTAVSTSYQVSQRSM